MKTIFSLRGTLASLAAIMIAVAATADVKGRVAKSSTRFHSAVKGKSADSHRKVAELREKANRKVSEKLRMMWGDYVPEPPVQATVIDPVIPEPDILPYPDPVDREQEAVIEEPVIPPPFSIPEPLVDQDKTLPVPLLDTPPATDPYVNVPEAVIPVIDRRQAIGTDPIARNEKVNPPLHDTPVATDPVVKGPVLIDVEVDRRLALGNDPVADDGKVTRPVLDTPVNGNPVVTVPLPVAPVLPSFTVEMYDCDMKFPVVPMFSLGSIDRVADAWDLLSADERYDFLVRTLYHTTSRNSIAGWAALGLADALASRLTADETSQAFLMTWLMVQLGYDMRLIETTDGRLLSAFGTDDVILSSQSRNFFLLPIGGKRYYSWQDTGDSFPPFRSHSSLGDGLQPVSLAVTVLPSGATGEEKSSRSSARLCETIEVATAAPGMLKYYESYPRFCPSGGDVVTQWFNYANAPASNALAATLEEPLRKKVDGMEPLEAVNTILTFVQDAFPYGYDDRIWGYDRPFFPDESVYYPKSDCEDHAILFTRLVRDILGLKCALVYYPNHLAAAVEIPGDVKGDYINADGRRFIICDPTYSRPAGYTMPGMSNSTAQAGLLP